MGGNTQSSITNNLYAGNSSVICDTGNGHGAVNTKVRIFTNATTLGLDITRATTGNNGDSFTINTAGGYFVSWVDRATGASCAIGLSLNSAQLTTSVATITTANRIHLVSTAAANLYAEVSALVICVVGDVIRPHDDGTPNDATAVSQFRIVRVF